MIDYLTASVQSHYSFHIHHMQSVLSKYYIVYYDHHAINFPYVIGEYNNTRGFE